MLLKVKKSLWVLYCIFPFLMFSTGAGSTNITIEAYDYSPLYVGLPFEMPVLERPIIPDYQVYLKDFGGVADGLTLNTQAFEDAMNHLDQKGGGVLYVSEGLWLTGPIVFKSNIHLYIDKGAVILFSRNYDDYKIIKTFFEGKESYRCQSPISGMDLENIAITGEGTINGSGDAWRPVKRGKVNQYQWGTFLSRGGTLKDSNYWLPFENAQLGEQLMAKKPLSEFTDEEVTSVKGLLRPVMVSFISCKNIFLSGVLFENSPAWNIHPLMCENIIIDGINVRNPHYSQNGDGLDLESCKNALVVNSTFDVGDDAICLKSGKDESGRRRGMPTENVIVNNCQVFHGHGGFVVGSEMSGGVRNISVSQCQFMGTDVGLRFKSTRGRGGIVENIYIDKITMFDIVNESFIFDLYYATKWPEKEQTDFPVVDETTPVFRNIFVSNILSRNVRIAMLFNGLPEMNIDNIHISNMIVSSQTGAKLSEASNIKIKNLYIESKEGPALILNNVKHLDVEGLNYPESKEEMIQVSGSRNENLQIPMRKK